MSDFYERCAKCGARLLDSAHVCMTPHDSTRCACGDRFIPHPSCPLHGTHSEPVGAVDAHIVTAVCQDLDVQDYYFVAICIAAYRKLARATPAEGEAVAWIVADKDGRLNDDEITTWEDFAHERVKEANRQAPLLAPWRVIPLYTTPPRSPATVTEVVVREVERILIDSDTSEYTRNRVVAFLTGGRDAE